MIRHIGIVAEWLMLILLLGGAFAHGLPKEPTKTPAPKPSFGNSIRHAESAP